MRIVICVCLGVCIGLFLKICSGTDGRGSRRRFERNAYIFFLLEESMRDAASILYTCFGGDLIVTVGKHGGPVLLI